jgi:hypothetical protein
VSGKRRPDCYVVAPFSTRAARWSGSPAPANDHFAKLHNRNRSPVKPRPLIPTAPTLLALAQYASAQDEHPTRAEKATQAQVGTHIVAVNKGDAVAGIYAEDRQ